MVTLDVSDKVIQLVRMQQFDIYFMLDVLCSTSKENLIDMDTLELSCFCLAV